MPKRYTSRELIKIVEKNGWNLKRITGSHHHFRHQTKPGTVTIPHPSNNIHIKTALSILKQAGLR